MAQSNVFKGHCSSSVHNWASDRFGFSAQVSKLRFFLKQNINEAIALDFCGFILTPKSSSSKNGFNGAMLASSSSQLVVCKLAFVQLSNLSCIFKMLSKTNETKAGWNWWEEGESFSPQWKRNRPIAFSKGSWFKLLVSRYSKPLALQVCQRQRMALMFQLMCLIEGMENFLVCVCTLRKNFQFPISLSILFQNSQCFEFSCSLITCINYYWMSIPMQINISLT